jgi:hypothetical protein
MGQNGFMQFQVGVVAAAVGSLALFISAEAQAQTVKIELTSFTKVANITDTKPKGVLNKGDQIKFGDLLKNRAEQFGKKKGQAVAFDSGTIFYTNGRQTGRKVTCTATFPGIGTISYQGLFKTGKDGWTIFPITGGTGAFTGVTGTVSVGPGTASSTNIIVANIPHHFDINARGVA